MTQPPVRPAFEEPPPRIDVEPVIRTSAGSPVTVRVTIANSAPEPRVVAMVAMGVDAGWLPPPTRTRVLMPGSSTTLTLVLRPAAGTLPARYPLAVTAQAIDPMSGRATSPAALADTTLVVDAPGQIEISIDPAEVSTRSRKGFVVRIRNIGLAEEHVSLEVQTSDAADVRVRNAELDIPAGVTTTVPGQIKVKRHLLGGTLRHTYTISARASAAPRRAEGAIVARSYLGTNGFKAAALLAIVATWVALAAVFIPKLATTIQSREAAAANRVGSVRNGVQSSLAARASAAKQQAKQRASAAKQSASRAKQSAQKQLPTTPSGGSGASATPTSGPTATSASTGSTATTAPASGKSSSHAGSTTAPGKTSAPGKTTAPGKGGSSTKTKTAKPTAKPSSTAAAGTGTVQLSGTVVGVSPSRVTVSMAPTSLVDQDAQGAKQVGGKTLASGDVGKIWGNQLAATTPKAQSENRATRTKSDGAWSFGRVRSPGYYLLTFSKLGYQTQRYVIDSSTAVATNPLSVDLLPGDGRISGVVTSAAGAVGGASISISDGTNTVTTSTVSTGAVGHWSVNGLSTPGSYLVTASQSGLSTESILVDLTAGAVSSANLTLLSAATSVSGTVQGVDSLGNLVGLGGVQVAVAGGGQVRTATTVTNGSLAGFYQLPDLPPGTYVVSMTAAGYLTESQRITIKQGEAHATVNSSLTSASATVYGDVTGVTFDRTTGAEVTKHGKAVIGPIDGAGIILSSQANTYKITSAADGSFRVSGVAPGTYILSAQSSGLTTAYVTVTVHAGQVIQVPGSALVLGVISTSDTGDIAGFVASASPSGTLVCPSKGCKVSFTLINSAGGAVRIEADGSSDYTSPALESPAVSGPTGYTLKAKAGIPAGVYHLTIGSTGYLPVTVQVRVPAGGTAQAPQVTLYQADTLTGTIYALGNMATDGESPLASPYVVCVYAIPTTSSIAVPTHCGEVIPPSTECEDKAIAVPGYAEATADPADSNKNPGKTYFQYTLSGLCDGSYNVYLETSNPWYLDAVLLPTTKVPTPVVLAKGATVTSTTQIPRKPRAVLTLSAMSPAGAAIGLSSTSAAVTCGGVAATMSVVTTTVTVNKIKVPVYTVIESGLDAGDGVTCKVSIDALNVMGEVDGLRFTDNTDTKSSLVLTEPVTGPVWGQVVSPYGTSLTNPAKNVILTITGITGYQGTTPVMGTTEVTTNANGCFAISPDGTSVNTGTGKTSPCGTIQPPPDPGSGVGIAYPSLKLVSNIVTVDTTGPGFEDSSTPKFDVSSDHQITVTATPLAFEYYVGGQFAQPQVLTVLGAATDLSKARITISDAKTAVGAGTVAVTAASDGTLTWTDSSTGNFNLVSPGTYVLTATLAGYQSVSTTLTCVFAQLNCEQLTPTFQLVQQGTISGTLIGYSGQDQTYPSHPLVSGTNNITAVRCTSTDATTCGTTYPNVVKSGTDASGNWSFQVGTSAVSGVGQYWQVTLTYPGYNSYTAPVIMLIQGDNGIDRNYLVITQVTFTIHLTNGTSTAFLKCPLICATVTLVRPDATVDDRTLTATSGDSYEFTNVNPAVYTISVSAPNIQFSQTTYTISPTDSSTDTDNIPVVVISNTVTGGVNGPAGQSGAVTALSGVSVELGTMQGTTFEVSQDYSGNDMITTTGPDGTFEFTDVPDCVSFTTPPCSYVARVNGLSTSSVWETYAQKVISPFPLNVSGGSSANFGFIALTQIYRPASVSITTTAAGDDISSATVTLTSASDSTWILQPTSSPTTQTGAKAVYTWTFAQVVAGDWTVSLTLPALHFGTLTAADKAGNCTVATLTTPGVCTADLPVDATSDATTGAVYSDGLDEFDGQFTVQLGTHLGLNPKSKGAPTTASVVVTTGTGTGTKAGPTVYDKTIPIDTVGDSVWLDAGSSYLVTTDAGVTNWTTATSTLTSKAPTDGVLLDESGSTVTVTLTGLPSDEAATVTLSAGTTSGFKSPTAMTLGNGVATFVFKKIPYDMNWSAVATAGTGQNKISSPTPGAAFPVEAPTAAQSLALS